MLDHSTMVILRFENTEMCFFKVGSPVYIVIHGYTWLYMAMTWLHMAIHSYAWLYMAIHSYPWLYIAMHGYT